MPKDLDVCTDVPTDTLVDYGQPQPVMDEGIGLKEGTRSDCQAPAPQDWTTTYTAYAKGHVQGTFAPLFPLKMCLNPSVAAERVRTRANDGDDAGEPGADHKPADQLLLVPRFPIWVPAPLTPHPQVLAHVFYAQVAQIAHSSAHARRTSIATMWTACRSRWA